MSLSNAEKFAHISDGQFTEWYIKEGRSARKTGKHFGMSPAAAQHRCNKLGLRSLCPRIEDKTQKREALLDPAWEARQALAEKPIRPVDVLPSQDLFDLYTKRVLCRECFRFVSAVSSPARTRNSHLWKHFPECSTHEERVDKYKKLHPGARLFPIASASVGRKEQDTLRKLAKDFASYYVTASDLIEWRKDPERGDRCGFDFWVCLECGRILGPNSDPYAHIVLHGYNDARSYRATWAGAPLSTQALRLKDRIGQAERNARKKAELSKLKVKVEKVPHRPPEDRRAARADQLRKQGLTWKVVQERIEREFKIHTTAKALHELRTRYIKRQERMKKVS